MKTLILFASKYGGSEKCANLLSEKLNGDVTVVNLKENKKGNSDVKIDGKTNFSTISKNKKLNSFILIKKIVKIRLYC